MMTSDKEEHIDSKTKQNKVEGDNGFKKKLIIWLKENNLKLAPSSTF